MYKKIIQYFYWLFPGYIYASLLVASRQKK